jgi:hypothetical protein
MSGDADGIDSVAIPFNIYPHRLPVRRAGNDVRACDMSFGRLAIERMIPDHGHRLGSTEIGQARGNSAGHLSCGDSGGVLEYVAPLFGSGTRPSTIRSKMVTSSMLCSDVTLHETRRLAIYRTLRCTKLALLDNAPRGTTDGVSSLWLLCRQSNW